MKTASWVILSLILAVDAAWGTDTNVYSQNAVGYVQLVLPPTGGCVFAAVNFKASEGNILTLAAIFGTNQLIQDNIYARADKVYLWNPVLQEFERYAQKPSGDFYLRQNWTNGSPANPAISNGVGFWLQSSSIATNTRTLYIMGEVVSNGAVSSAMYPGYQCIGSPFTSDLAMTNNDWLADGAVGSSIQTNADQIVIWNGNGFDRYGLAADGRWHSWTNWGGAAVDLVITLGKGGWYLSKTNATWTWTQPKPYLWP